MQGLIIVFLIIITVVFATLYILLHKELKNITKQLKEINNTKTNSKILISFSNNLVKNLALEINKSLEKKSAAEAEHKRMDLEIRQSISNISHDLRTPLTSIIGYIQLMEDDSLSQNERSQYIDIIKKRAKSLQTLICSFYDLSRLEGREYKFDLKALNLYNILCDLIAVSYNDFISNEIEPIIDIDEQIPMIIADENAVRRIISNLIQNMIKYSNEFISISLKYNKDHIILNFTNDAPNLKEDDVKYLFQRFFTADRTRSGESTGLGLAIAKELVEQMGHEIFAKLSKDKLSIIIKWKVINDSYIK
ncbi:two-component sensor histidine kinase [Clostridium tetani]|uniref:sensor histidine kinase n=1 Tax=Clostridium tetani TaxID=1513 RepID=UPI000512B176|nr:HAMP domain-containing sensor histidine kinase [Clostridium tetani]KGI43491.1 histidine kinase [Clostridium tetani]BDR71063.1 two-component sensor histidine kinase [Clostridium tetani]BDR76879.1 two-component sensor histidine kinase [Clostridium tetani]BDR87995.1 two-component sensor histidine kinase [Clostridium tetani]BEV20700.1 HAMP domain-containing sensor histidine kinase [Clostridium tetani]